MANYMQIITYKHPNDSATCNGNPEVYSDIEWDGTPIAQATLDGEWLETYKHFKNEQINAKTRALILGGFTWNSVEFSTTDVAQRNWLALKAFSDVLTYPKRISTKDDDHYDLVDATELSNFTGYALGVLEARYAAGVTLRDAVNAATDEAGVDAVVDNR